MNDGMHAAALCEMPMIHSPTQLVPSSIASQQAAPSLELSLSAKLTLLLQVLRLLAAGHGC
jgi:hypothetical protein